MKYNKLKLIQLIAEKQKKHKETYDSIGLSVGLSGNMVGLINNGKSIPSVDSLAKFAEYFGKDINYFFDNNAEAYILKTPVETYEKKENDPWKLLYEKQEEITFLKVEIERLKNYSAHGKSANAG